MKAHDLPLAVPQSNDDPIDLLHYWRVVRQHWKGILGLALVVSMLATLSVMRATPIYRASTTIMIESQRPNTVSIQEVYDLQYRNFQYFTTQFQIITTREVAELAADNLNLWDNPNFIPRPSVEDTSSNQAPKEGVLDRLKSVLGMSTEAPKVLQAEASSAIDAEEAHRAAVIGAILAGLSVEQRQYTQLGSISFVSPNQQLAADIPNAIAEAYIQSQLDSKLKSTEEASQWLYSRLGDLKANLDASQMALQEFRDREQILEVEGGQDPGVQELNELNSRLGEARKVRMETEIILEELQRSGDYSISELMSMPTVLQHPLVQNLAESLTAAQQDVANLSRRYGPEHPRMINARAREQSVQYELREQLEQVSSSVEAEYRVAKRNEEQLAARVAEARTGVSSLNRKEFRLRELEQKVEADQRLYDMFFTRAKETAEATGFQTPHARIIERAIMPVTPFTQGNTRKVLVAFIASILVGIGLAILRDRLDNTLKSADDVADRLHVPLLGTIPEAKQPKNAAGAPYLGYLEDGRSNFAEAIRTLRTGLVLSGLEKPHKITVVTSTNPGEGKSTVAINLAAALAQMENVLLIDADLRRPSVARAFQLPNGAPGLSSLLAQTDNFEQCVQRVDAGFDVLPAGIVPSNPQEMLSTVGFKALVKDLAKRYDRVIVDSAPLNVVSDSLLLATLADSLVYIARADSTPYRLAQKNINLIKHSNLPLTGVVLNRVDLGKQGSYGKGGYYNSYYGYGES